MGMDSCSVGRFLWELGMRSAREVKEAQPHAVLDVELPKKIVV